MQAEECVFNRRNAILLQQLSEATEQEYLHCLKPLSVMPHLTMTFNKAIRTIVPPIIGYFIYLLCNGLLQIFFSESPLDDLSTPGDVFLIEFVFQFIWTIIFFVFQYKFIVPRTSNSVRRAVIWTLTIGFAFSLIFFFMSFADEKYLKGATITFLRFFVPIESFFLGDLATIAVFNLLTNKQAYRTNEA